jgi:G3E family GTPase
MVEQKKKKIYFFNGALGSGKTTLINQLIDSKKLGNFFIIENEIASLGIDNQCLHLDPKQIKILAGECICCRDPQELSKILKNICTEESGKYENVVIESSGVTSMNQLLENILKDQELAELYEIGACVFVVDALGINRTNVFDLETSDFVVVSKIDALQTDKQKNNLNIFINQEYKDLVFYQKQNEEDVEWVEDLLKNKSKSFREWNLLVNDSKHHGTNFVKILGQKELANFGPQNLYKNMYLYQIVRIKGFYSKEGKIVHVEMTPEQFKENFTENGDEKVGVVVIGQNKLLLEEFVALEK